MESADSGYSLLSSEAKRMLKRVYGLSEAEAIELIEVNDDWETTSARRKALLATLKEL